MTRFTDAFTRRGLLRLGVAGAALLTCPGPLFRRRAFGQARAPHFFVMMFADGGWDPTQTIDPHDPLDESDGIDVDVPEAVSGLPPSTIATAGGLTYVSNPTTRPAVDAYFLAWGSRTAIVNGIATRSTSHDQSRQLVLTGALDASRADFAVLAAHVNGSDLPLPHLLVSGESYGGPFAGLSGRLGGQMRDVMAWNRLGDGRLALSAVGEAHVRQALEWEQLLEQGLPAHALTARVTQFHDANGRADRMAQLAASLRIDGSNGRTLAASLATAFRSGLAASVSIRPSGGFDTHDDNTLQNARWNQVFTFLDNFVAELAAQPGVASASLLDETTVVFCSEFSRTPKLNGDNGKDHHPWASMILVGKGVRGGTTVGLTDGDQEGVPIDFATGQPSDTGQVLDVANMVAGLVTLAGGNPATYLPTVRPCTAFIA